MNRRTLMLGTIVAAAMGLVGVQAQAASFPNKGIELIVPYSAGGGTDLVARAFADAANKHLSKAIGVVNRTGGGGAVGLTAIAKARPNGYTVGMGTAEITMLPHMGLATFKADEFKAVAQLNADPSAITVRADAPWNTVEEFLAYAKEHPGEVRVGNSGTGAIWHLAAEALSKETGVKFNNVPFEGANPAVTSLLGGHIEAVSVSPAEVSNFVKAGTLKMLGVMADERVKAFPDVPTLKEGGIDLSIGTWRGIVVPNKVPEDALKVIGEVTKQAADDPAFQEQLAKMNLNFFYLDGEAFQKKIAHDDVYYKQLMTDLGLAK
ncbi:Bug family tripartite tricarboxylate transporter substrate binding protein [Cohaesibacter haloalkalitolerans]|uniref:Bug family tripartite tricarboxylate transporter substrate binding protein n=1 Tax=Cohaesibacter haloalkalitolerans TaxID=1162980 RepID=UPI000E6521FD|nr:tripartite tricarboxylate transporter substrate binding protein [Cohaesibacter haloalkalitolerans]